MLVKSFFELIVQEKHADSKGRSYLAGLEWSYNCSQPNVFNLVEMSTRIWTRETWKVESV